MPIPVPPARDDVIVDVKVAIVVVWLIVRVAVGRVEVSVVVENGGPPMTREEEEEDGGGLEGDEAGGAEEAGGRIDDVQGDVDALEEEEWAEMRGAKARMGRKKREEGRCIFLSLANLLVWDVCCIVLLCWW